MPGSDHILTKGALVTGSAAYKLGDLLILSTASTTYPFQVAKSTASTDRIIGVANEALDVGKVTTGKAFIGVNMLGVCKVIAGASLSQGARVMPGASGTAAQAITAATATNIPFGLALTAAGAQGDIIDVLLTPNLPPL
jgi:hypothetical protein